MHGPWEEHREAVALRLQNLELARFDHGRRLRSLEDMLANRATWASFWGAVAGTVAVIVPLSALLAAVWHYAK